MNVNNLMRVSLLLVIGTLALGVAVAEAIADVTVIQNGMAIEYRLTLTPAKEPSPAFRYRFTVPLHETIPGNAITHYLRSLGENSLDSPLEAAQKEFGMEFYEWSSSDKAAADIDLEKLKKASSYFDSYVDDHIRRATLCRDCEWGLAIETMRGPEAIEFLLPSVQQTRSMARVLMLQNKLAIMEGRFDDSVDRLRMMYKLADSVNQQGFLVSSLVGVAQVGMANDGALQLMATDNSPNLYWALAGLPQPVIDTRKAIQFEASLGQRYFAELDGVETLNLSDEEWGKKFVRTMEDVNRSFGMLGLGRRTQPQLPSAAAAMAIAMVSYPESKRRLIEQGVASVEAMPVAQVVLIDAARRMRVLADEAEKAYCLEYPDFRKVSDEFEERLEVASRRDLGSFLAGLLFPATRQVQAAKVRVQSQVNELMIVESIRNHVATNGELPNVLGDLALPARINPWTGKPYTYSIKDGKAVLKVEGAIFQTTYVIEFKK